MGRDERNESVSPSQSSPLGLRLVFLMWL